MTIGLTIAEMVATNLGNKSNTMFRISRLDGQGKDANGDTVLGLAFQVYESRAKYDAGDNPLTTAGFSQVRTITIASGTEISETTTHQVLSALLATEGFTVTEETVV